MTAATPAPRSMLALTSSPVRVPKAWAGAVALGASGVSIINVGPNERDRDDVALRRGITSIVAAGGEALGHVSLGYATRPLHEILAEISRWADLPVSGVFLDHAPSGPYQVGPVVQAVRAARRYGLQRVIVNPGVRPDTAYRLLDATLCTFEGSWTEYLAWSGEGGAAGDGHLIYGVPAHEAATARALAARHGAGLALVSTRPAAQPGRQRTGGAEALRAVWSATAAAGA